MFNGLEPSACVTGNRECGFGCRDYGAEGSTLNKRFIWDAQLMIAIQHRFRRTTDPLNLYQLDRGVSVFVEYWRARFIATWQPRGPRSSSLSLSSPSSLYGAEFGINTTARTICTLALVVVDEKGERGGSLTGGIKLPSQQVAQTFGVFHAIFWRELPHPLADSLFKLSGHQLFWREGGWWIFRIWGGLTLRKEPVVLSSGVVGGCLACVIRKVYRVVTHFMLVCIFCQFLVFFV